MRVRYREGIAHAHCEHEDGPNKHITPNFEVDADQALNLVQV